MRVGAVSSRLDVETLDVDNVILHLFQVSEVVLLSWASKHRVPVPDVVESWRSYPGVQKAEVVTYDRTKLQCVVAGPPLISVSPASGDAIGMAYSVSLEMDPRREDMGVATEFDVSWIRTA